MNARLKSALRVSAGLLLASTALTASAQALRTFAGSTANSFPANDDGSTGLVNIGFGINFFGGNFTQLFVNNNGNVTLNSPLGTFTPSGLTSFGSNPIIAPYWADVDTRAPGSLPVTYGTGTLGSFNAFAVNWDHVGVFGEISIFNNFQLVLIDRSDTGAGNFDFEFNYTLVNWETGTASGGNSLGLGGFSAHVGYNSGTGTSFELGSSGVNGAFLDNNLATGLIHNALGTPFDNTVMNGRYDFNVRNGSVTVEPPPSLTTVPEPSTYGFIASGVLVGLVALRRRKLASIKAA